MCSLVFRKHGSVFHVGSAPEELGVAGGGAGGVQVAGAEEVGAAVAHFQLQFGEGAEAEDVVGREGVAEGVRLPAAEACGAAEGAPAFGPVRRDDAALAADGAAGEFVEVNRASADPLALVHRPMLPPQNSRSPPAPSLPPHPPSPPAAAGSLAPRLSTRHTSPPGPRRPRVPGEPLPWPLPSAAGVVPSLS